MKNSPATKSGGLSARDYWLACVIAIAFAGFHFLHGQQLTGTVLLKSLNWVFDFDSSRFLIEWCTFGADLSQHFAMSYLPRHSLSPAIRPLCLGLTAILGDPGIALMALTALGAGGAVAIAGTCRYANLDAVDWRRRSSGRRGQTAR